MDQKQILTRIALNNWQTQVDRASKFINELSDDQLMKEIAPGKNRGIYLVGHLVAIHDAMTEILGIGKKDYPEMLAVFVEAPDKSVEIKYTIADLRKKWVDIHEKLKKQFAEMPTDAWFARHELMTDADYEKDPTRNKLSVLITRVGHLAYHFGQLRLLK